MEKTRSVSRCVAVAAHGRRCQQSPFRGSPYCWHHTQSRKVWAPSRPLSGGPSAVRLVEIEPVPSVDDPEPRADGPEASADLEAAARLARALGPARTEALLRFLEGSGERDFTIVKDDGAGAAGARLGRAARRAAG